MEMIQENMQGLKKVRYEKNGKVGKFSKEEVGKRAMRWKRL